MTLGKRFKFIREASGHTQESLEAASGISRSTIVKIENDASSPTIQTLHALLKECNSNLASFFSIHEANGQIDPQVIWQVQAVLSQNTEAARVIRWALQQAAPSQALPAAKERSSKKQVRK